MKTCKHIGKKIGTADAKCAGIYNVYSCTLLHLPCTAHNVQVHSITLIDGSQAPTSINCAHCQQNTELEKPTEIPKQC